MCVCVYQGDKLQNGKAWSWKDKPSAYVESLRHNKKISEEC